MATEAPPKTIIEPRKGWQLINWKELVRYRDLFYFLVLRDVKVLYKQTILGFAWAIIQPLFQMVVFTLIFGKLAKVSSDGAPYALFNYVALVPWTYFSSSLNSSTTSLVSNANMLTKVYFPRLVIPMTPVLAKLVDFGIAFMLIGVLMVIYGVVPTWGVLYLPLLVLLMMLTASGAGMWLSALTIQYRDIRFASTFLTQLLMYAAPVVWPVSLITERISTLEVAGVAISAEAIRLVYGLYPMAGVIEGFRSAIIGTTPMPWDLIGMSTGAALLLYISGAFYFKRMERRFADVA